MIELDGSYGEGGGQILRTALGLSLVTGTAFRIVNIRAGRKRPGLLRQHLTCVRAAAEVGGAGCRGAAIGSRELRFEPEERKAGSYHFAVGTAGSTTLVLQTVLPALLGAGSSSVTVEGGTHNPWAPPFEAFQAFLDVLGRMGARVSTRMERYGFHPAGGGRIVADVAAGELEPVELMQRGSTVERRGRAVVSNLAPTIAQRELTVLRKKLGLARNELELVEADAHGPGNVVIVEIRSAHIREVFTGFGQPNRRAEAVAAHAAHQARSYLAADVPVGEYLADQLLIPFAMAVRATGRPCAFRTLAPSGHCRTNIEVVERFLPVRIETAEDDGTWTIRLSPR